MNTNSERIVVLTIENTGKVRLHELEFPQIRRGAILQDKGGMVISELFVTNWFLILR